MKSADKNTAGEQNKEPSSDEGDFVYRDLVQRIHDLQDKLDVEKKLSWRSTKLLILTSIVITAETIVLFDNARNNTSLEEAYSIAYGNFSQEDLPHFTRNYSKLEAREEHKQALENVYVQLGKLYTSEEKPVYIGSVFLFDKTGTVLFAAHELPEATTKLKFIGYGNAKFEITNIKKVGEHDLALGKINLGRINLKKVDFVNIVEDLPDIKGNAKSVTVGFSGYSLHATEGNYTTNPAINRLNVDSCKIAFSNTSYPGMSGGVNITNGSLAGIHVGSYRSLNVTKNPNSFAVPSAVIKLALKQAYPQDYGHLELGPNEKDFFAQRPQCANITVQNYPSAIKMLDKN